MPSDVTPQEIGAMPDTELAKLREEAFAAVEEGNPDKPAPEPDATEKPPESDGKPAETKPEPSKDGQPVTEPTADPVQKQLSEFGQQIKALSDGMKEVIALNQNLQKLNGHLGNEVGRLRAEKGGEKPPELPKDTDFLDRPADSTRKTVEAVLAEEKRRKEAEETATKTAVEMVMTRVKANVPDFEALIPDMAEILKQRGASPEAVKVFQQFPALLIPSPEHLVELAHNALGSKSLTAKEQRIAELEKQIEELKKGPEKMAENLQQAAKAGPTITSRNVKPRGETKPEATADVSKWSDAQIKAFKKEHGIS